jgi:hypothetical protein
LRRIKIKSGLWSSRGRRFFDIAQGGPAPIASEAPERIAALYAREDDPGQERRRTPCGAAEALLGANPREFEPNAGGSAGDDVFQFSRVL